MKLIYCVLLLLCPYMSKAQPLAKAAYARALNLGDVVPNIVFNTVVNNNTSSIQLHQLKGKLILLDFWATWCSACIKKFPLLDSLQQQYGAQLQILLVNSLVTNDNTKKIQAAFKKLKNPAGKPYAFVSAVADTAAYALFPYQTIPQYVWLDSNYRVLAISSSEDLTTANVAAFMNGQQPQLDRKQDQLAYNRNQPWFINGNAGEGNNICYRSTLAGWLPGLTSGFYQQTNKDGMVTAIRAANQSPLSLLLLAHNSFFNNNRVVNLAGYPHLFLPATNPNAWLKTHALSYELMLPAQPLPHALQWMQNDLKNVLGIYATDSLLTRPVYVLVVDSNKLLPFASKGGKRSNELDVPYQRQMRNCAIQTLVNFLDERMDAPVLNESAFTQKLDLQISLEQFDLPTVNRSLAPLGIQLHTAYRSTPSFVIQSSPKQPLL